MFKHLFQPLAVKSMQLPNRIVLPAMVTGFGDEDGHVTKRYLRYMEARAKGGTGLLITEAAYIAPSGRILRGEIGIHDDSCIDGLAAVVNAAHQHGSRIAIQLNHGEGRLLRKLLNVKWLPLHPFPAPGEKRFQGFYPPMILMHWLKCLPQPR